jgi:hypothetical protein
MTDWPDQSGLLDAAYKEADEEAKKHIDRCFYALCVLTLTELLAKSK